MVVALDLRRDRQQPRIVPAGDEAILVEFGPIVSREMNRKVRGLAGLLETAEGNSGDESLRGGWLVETVPAYSSLLVRYEPDKIAYEDLIALLQRLATRAESEDLPAPRRIDIPVRYGGEDGPDLGFVAEHAGMSEGEVVELHSQPIYVVYMLGFTPGFCYLGDLPPALAVPRRRSPRLRIPPGAVAIGGVQTGIYSIESPGGWRWIGRTDLPLWEPHRDPPVLVQAGDEVRFVPVC